MTTSTPSENDLRSLLDEGQTLYTISRKFNTTIPEIFKLGRSYGIHFAYDHDNIPKPTKQDLESMYNTEHLTQYQIGKEFGVTKQSVSRWLSDHNIPTVGRQGGKVPNMSKEVLEKMYSEDGMTQYQISQEFGVTPACVSMKFSKHNIPTRGGRGTLAVKMPPKEVLEKMYSEDGMTQYQIASKFNVQAHAVSDWICKHNIPTRGSTGTLAVKMPPKDELLNYIAEGLDQHQIAEEYNVCDATIFKWCEYYDIPGMVDGFRCTTPEHQAWRYAVFDRDHRTCQKCGATNTPMQAHHIVPFADHPEIGYEIENGITLCKECHKKTFGREYEYLEQFAAITQPHLRDHEVIESMPWEAPLPPLSDKLFPDYQQEAIPCLD